MALKPPERYVQTPGSVARQATALTGRPCSPDTVRRAANEGVIDYCRDAAGRRLYPDDAAAQLHLHLQAHGSFTSARRKPGGAGRTCR